MKSFFQKDRSSLTEVFCEKYVLKIFQKIHKKTPEAESCFSKVANFQLSPCNFTKIGIHQVCFLASFPKILRTACLQNNSKKENFHVFLRNFDSIVQSLTSENLR